MAARAQRPVLVRVGGQVQEVLRTGSAPVGEGLTERRATMDFVGPDAEIIDPWSDSI
jgi:hypothetical protein